VTPAATVGGDGSLRLFCALTLPAEALDRLVAWQADLPPGTCRPVPRENLHVTLAFLGSRPAAEVGSIGSELAGAAGAAGPIVLRELRYREARSVGMLVFHDDGDAAGALAHDLHERLHRLGVYEPERRPWLPHVTVVRFRERPRLSPPLPGLGDLVPSGAAVYMSRLRPAGAEYVVVQEGPLGEGGGSAD
jgi:RNA 2',3'-cyclic 3'-phosphodiesterase